jgi:hypothetical protein
MELKQTFMFEAFGVPGYTYANPSTSPTRCAWLCSLRRASTAARSFPNVYLDVDHRPDDIALHDLLRWP